MERRHCRAPVTIRSSTGDSGGLLLDISEGGVGFAFHGLMALKPGDRITLIHPRLGEVPLLLRWAAHPRYGAEFRAGPQALARILAFYDGLPPAHDDHL